MNSLVSEFSCLAVFPQKLNSSFAVFVCLPFLLAENNDREEGFDDQSSSSDEESEEDADANGDTLSSIISKLQSEGINEAHSNFPFSSFIVFLGEEQERYSVLSPNMIFGANV